MTEKDDKVQPYHAREVSTGAEAAEAVAAVLKHAQERDQAAKQKVAPKKQPKWMLPLGANLGLVAFYLLIFQPPWIELNPITQPPSSETRQRFAGSIGMAAGVIEQFRAREGRLPATLAEVGQAGLGIDYQRQGESAYVLSILLTEDQPPLVFNSAVNDLQTWGLQNAGNVSSRIGG